MSFIHTCWCHGTVHKFSYCQLRCLVGNPAHRKRFSDGISPCQSALLVAHAHFPLLEFHNCTASSTKGRPAIRAGRVAECFIHKFRFVGKSDLKARLGAVPALLSLTPAERCGRVRTPRTYTGKTPGRS